MWLVLCVIRLWIFFHIFSELHLLNFTAFCLHFTYFVSLISCPLMMMMMNDWQSSPLDEVQIQTSSFMRMMVWSMLTAYKCFVGCFRESIHNDVPLCSVRCLWRVEQALLRCALGVQIMLHHVSLINNKQPNRSF